MCGIAGILSVSEVVDAERRVGEMLNAIRHRGPDGEAVQCLAEKRVNLGHRRLAIVDLSDRGAQPMPFDSERYWIVFNGEIYNYVELRDQLTSVGYGFVSDCDTEVVLAAYAHWGVECLKRFNGMWAFLIFDSHEGRFFASRDRLGVKPFHYYCDGKYFLFASEIKALIASGLYSPRPNSEYLTRYIDAGPCEWGRETAFEGVLRLGPGEMFYGDLAAFVAGPKSVKWWTYGEGQGHEEFQLPQSESEWISEYRRRLDMAVAVRLRADVPIGSALSGGLDSSSIVSLVNRHLKEMRVSLERQHAFSVVYPDFPASTDVDESRFIRIMAGNFDLNSHEIQPESSVIPAQCMLNIFSMDNPPESSCMSAWHTFRLVSSKGIKVTLDGQGADEQLAGYGRYLINHLNSGGLRAILDSAIYALRDPASRKVFFLGVVYKISKILRVSKLLRSRLARRMALAKNLESSLDEVLRYDVMHGLVNLLHFADRTSMAFSVESRMPFLDFRFMYFLSQTPAKLKMKNGWNKWISRQAMEFLLPRQITWRKDKKGWAIPEKYWFRNVHADWAEEKIRGSDLARRQLERRGVDLETMRHMPIKKYMRYLNIALWEEVFFKRFDEFVAEGLPSYVNDRRGKA